MSPECPQQCPSAPKMSSWGQWGHTGFMWGHCGDMGVTTEVAPGTVQWHQFNSCATSPVSPLPSQCSQCHPSVPTASPVPPSLIVPIPMSPFQCPQFHPSVPSNVTVQSQCPHPGAWEGLYWSVELHTGLNSSLPVSTGLYWFPASPAPLYWSILVYTGLNCFILVRAEESLCWSVDIHTGSYWSEFDYTGPYQSELVPTALNRSILL